MVLQTGQVLNQRYRIVQLLGQGGFGAVYHAWDTSFDLPCALKENTETSPEARRQFMREAQLLHTLRHPNLPLVKDYFIVPDEGQYLVMDYIGGEDLETVLKQHRAPLAEDYVVEWLVQICDALTYLHTHVPSVIHRDIKPANIKIALASGGSTQAQEVLNLPLEQTRAYLVDFGISKVYDPSSRTTLGARAVTPGYSPFEQYGHAPTDARTDIYALGATAYSLLTNQVPPESISRMSGEELPAPRSINPSLSLQVEGAIMRALEVMPDQRFNNAVEFRDALRAPRIVTTPDRPQPPTVVAPPPTVRQSPTTSLTAEQLPHTEVVQAKPLSRKKRTAIWPWFVALGLLVVTAMAVFAIWQASYLFPIGVISPTKPFQEQPVEPPPPEVTEPIHEQPIEPPPPEVTEPIQGQPDQPHPEFGPMSGEWAGIIAEIHGERVNYEIRLFIEHPPGSETFRGEMEVRFPDGHQEVREIIEGIFIGEEFRFKDSAGLHFRGVFRGDHLAGQASWDCYDCEPWSNFELSR